MLEFTADVMLLLSAVHRSARSRQKFMDLSKQNVNTVFSHLEKWLISSNWITLACQYM